MRRRRHRVRERGRRRRGRGRQVPAVVASPRRRGGPASAVRLRALAAAALLIVGAAAGAGIAIPVATGMRRPGSASRPTCSLPPMRRARGRSQRPRRRPFRAQRRDIPGHARDLGATLPGQRRVHADAHERWHNGACLGGGQPGRSRDARAGGSTRRGGAAAQVGTLAPSGSATLTISGSRGGSYHIVITAPAGAVELLPPSC